MSCDHPAVQTFPWLVRACFAWVLAFASCAQADFWDPLFRNGALRTEYAKGFGTQDQRITLDYVTGSFHTDFGCLWNVDDPLSSFFRCPGRRDHDANVWLGTMQEREGCGGDTTPIGDSWVGCLSYRRDTYFALGAPGDRYWVVHANNDPAFDQCRSGPPSASEPIVDPVAQPTRPNLYKVALERQANGNGILSIIVAPWEHDFACAGYVNPDTGGNKQFTIPYLSVGAHRVRGNGEAVAIVHRSLRTSSDVLAFDAQLRGHAAIGCRGDQDDPCDPAHAGVHAGVLITAQWTGVRRMLFLDLYHEGVLALRVPSRSHWSWPIRESMFWPGGEVAVMSANDVAQRCPDVVRIPMLAWPATSPSSYRINLRDVLVCAESAGLWSAVLPDDFVEIEAVDWFVEMSGTTGMLWLSVQNPLTTTD